MYYLVFPLGFIFGLFAASQIFLPILHSLPKLVIMERRGLLKKKPPLWYTLITPVIWILLTLLIVWSFDKFFPTNKIYFLIGLGISTFVILIQIPIKNKDLEKDFRHSYRNYLKEESFRDTHYEL